MPRCTEQSCISDQMTKEMSVRTIPCKLGLGPVPRVLTA